VHQVLGIVVGVFLSFTGVTGLAVADPASTDSATTALTPQYVAYNYSAANPTRIMACTRLDCPVNGYAHPSEILIDHCYVSGDSVYGNPWWDWIEDTANGVRGFVSEYYLRWQSQADHC
jgi:hypothetical protein